jgi:hypothetical protein
MPDSAGLRDLMVFGIILCVIGLERLLNAHLVGSLGSDFAVRLSTGLACTVTGVAVIVAWLRERSPLATVRTIPRWAAPGRIHHPRDPR